MNLLKQNRHWFSVSVGVTRAARETFFFFSTASARGKHQSNYISVSEECLGGRFPAASAVFFSG